MKLIIRAIVLFLGMAVLAGLGTNTVLAQVVEDPIKKQMNLDLQDLALQLAQTLKSPEFRKNYLFEEIRSAHTQEQILDFEEILTKADGRTDIGLESGALKKLSEMVTGIIKRIRISSVSPRLRKGGAAIDLYFPVVSHRKKWRGSEELLVTYAPLGDEDKITSVTAYSVKDGLPVTLDAKKAPDTPTLVLAIEEHRTHDPIPPLQTNPKPLEEQEEQSPTHEGNSYIGIPQLLLKDDNEGWFKGDPEIYVLIGQTYMTSPIPHRIELPGVNDVNKWYWIGDGPSYPLYFYFNTNYGEVTYFHFMEEDGEPYDIKQISLNGVTLKFPINDSDDSAGAKYVDRDQILWGGYLKLSTGEVDFYVDKDY